MRCVTAFGRTSPSRELKPFRHISTFPGQIALGAKAAARTGAGAYALSLERNCVVIPVGAPVWWPGTFRCAGNGYFRS